MMLNGFCWVNFNAIKNIIQPYQKDILQKINYDGTKKVKNPERMPEKRQIQDVLAALHQQFPLLKVELIIKALHHVVHPQCNRQVKNKNISGLLPPTQNGHPKQDYSKINSNIRQKQNFRMSQHIPFSKEQKVAISFLNHGYGIKIMKQNIHDEQIAPNTYNNTITLIMKQTFRKLQQFLQKLKKINVTSLSSRDQRLIRAPLTCCQTWLPPDELQVFFKFIKLACKLQQVQDIRRDVAINLYNSCIRKLRERREEDERESKVRKGRRNSKNNSQVRQEEGVPNSSQQVNGHNGSNCHNPNNGHNGNNGNNDPNVNQVKIEDIQFNSEDIVL